MNLKELTWENHKKAERRGFAKILLSGEIDPELYYRYLTNQYYNYVILEDALKVQGLPVYIQPVFRASHILKDMQELEELHGFFYDPYICTVSNAQYIEHIYNLEKKNEYEKLIAHMYVRHFGDMYGGAIIKKRVPGSGAMYEFDDKEKLKVYVRELLTDEMAVEANICFEFAIRLFEELENVTDLGKLTRA